MRHRSALTAFAAVLSIAITEPSALVADEPAVPAAVAKAADAPKPTAAPFVTVELTVIEVNLTKLRAIGFDWLEVGNEEHAQKLFGDAKKTADFLRALERNGLAEFLSRPQLMTQSGRPASVAIGDLKLDIVPIVLESGRIRVEHHLELDHSGVKLKSNGAVEVDSGLVAIASQARGEKKDAAGKVHETDTLVVIRATTAEVAQRRKSEESR